MMSFLRPTIEKIFDRIHAFSPNNAAQADVGVNKEKAADRAEAKPAEEKSLSSPETHLRDTEWLLTERRRQKFIDLYLFAVDASLRGAADQWWQRAFSYDQLPDPEQGVKPLKDFCLHHLLYEAGDVPAFRRAYEVLEEEGQFEGDDRGRFLSS
jgi:hypothetical protein